MKDPPSKRPPNAHKLFSTMFFVRNRGSNRDNNDDYSQQLDEFDNEHGEDEEADFADHFLPSCTVEKPVGGWLESDDIDDF